MKAENRDFLTSYSEMSHRITVLHIYNIILYILQSKSASITKNTCAITPRGMCSSHNSCPSGFAGGKVLYVKLNPLTKITVDNTAFMREKVRPPVFCTRRHSSSAVTFLLFIARQRSVTLPRCPPLVWTSEHSALVANLSPRAGSEPLCKLAGGLSTTVAVFIPFISSKKSWIKVPLLGDYKRPVCHLQLYFCTKCPRTIVIYC